MSGVYAVNVIENQKRFSFYPSVSKALVCICYKVGSLYNNYSF